MSDKKSAILRVAKGLTENYASEELFMPKSGRRLPNRSVIIDIVRDLKSIVFPGYFSTDTSATVFPEYYVGHRLNDLYDRLKNQIEIALLYHGEEPEEAAAHADRTACGFFEQLPEIQRLLLTDVQAGFDGDPRVMSEYAHGRTGIDINPGATIGEYFFIDHGTGVVVGETTEIGNNVKLYQGVTLGALSTRKGQQLANVKRHPTIRDNVTIYSNSTVLGGETVITESIPANTKVSAKSPELVIKKPKAQVSATNVWEY